MTNLPPRRKAFLKKKPLKRKPRKLKKDIWTEFGLTRPPKPRYSGLQGVLWYVMSIYVRKSEFEAYNGECVDGCGRTAESWRDYDCGHFQSAARPNTRFLRENLGLQMKYCNSKWGGNGNQYGFGKMIDKRYGEGTADRITELAKQDGKNMKDDELREKIAYYLSIS